MTKSHRAQYDIIKITDNNYLEIRIGDESA